MDILGKVIVNEAIYAVLKGGQSYKIGTRELARADLKQLLKMQKQLQAAVQGGEPSNLWRIRSLQYSKDGEKWTF